MLLEKMWCPIESDAIQYIEEIERFPSIGPQTTETETWVRPDEKPDDVSLYTKLPDVNVKNVASLPPTASILHCCHLL